MLGEWLKISGFLDKFNQYKIYLDQLKFPKLQYDQILKIIESNGFNLEEFYLVKRKGWIRIEYLQSNQYFTYFKVKETNIDPDTREWENNMFFKVKMSEAADCVEPSFDSMMGLFDNWVKKIKRGKNT
jgi:hypothetical protein